MKSILLSLLFSVVLFSACQPVHYIPNMNNVPVLQEKGEGSVSLGISTSGRDSMNQYSLHTAYLFTNHFAVKTNSVIYRFNQDFTRNRTRNSGQIHELGIGYVTNLDDNFVNLSIWGIIGTGNMKTVVPRQNEQLTTDLFLFGINPTASIATKNYSLSFSMKSFFLNYNNIKGNLDYNGINEIDYLQANNRAFILEPTLTERIGFKNFKFIGQTTFSRNLMLGRKGNFYDNDRQVNIVFSFGISYNFFTRKKEIPTDF